MTHMRRLFTMSGRVGVATDQGLTDATVSKAAMRQMHSLVDIVSFQLLAIRNDLVLDKIPEGGNPLGLA